MATEKNWPQTQVNDLIRRGVLVVNDGYRVRNVELGPVGIPFVRGGDIGNGGINTAVEDHIRPEFTDRVQSKLTRPFDVAFISKGTVGRVGFVRLGQPQAVFAPQVCYWRSLDAEQLDPRFLYYLLTSAEFQANLDAVKTHGSMVADYVSMSDQRDFWLTLPPFREQRGIAAVLEALDDKIDLNRRMNATLEAMARALFQSWFVDFDPVRAKLDGRQPIGTNKEAAHLFPNSFTETHLGPVPTGWNIGRIADCCERIHSGGTPSRSEPRYWDGGTIPWLGSGEVRQPLIVATENFITDSGLRESSAKWVRANSTVVALYGATAGQVSYLASEVTTNQAVCALIPKEHFAIFNYFTMRAATPEMESKAVGSAQQNISKGIIEEIKTVIPTERVLKRFNDVAAPMISQWVQSLKQSSTLAKLRDTLLPKLLSGELSVTEVSPA